LGAPFLYTPSFPLIFRPIITKIATEYILTIAFFRAKLKFQHAKLAYTGGGKNMEEGPEKKHGIMDTPLPIILDEIETAAADARKAAEEARVAGERAAEDVMKRLRKLFLKMAKDITEELGEGKKQG
jgi:hypothetical protein